MIIRRSTGAGTILILVILAVSMLVLAGCQPGQLETDEIDKKIAKKEEAHNLSTDAQEAMIKDAITDLGIIEQARGDSSKLGEALSGNALKNMRASMRKDAAAGKVKVRVWQDEELEFKNVISNIGGLSVQFNDLSYYVDAKTGKQLTEPQKAPFRFVLAMRKKESGDRWLIHGIYEWQAKDSKKKEEETFRP